MPAELILFDTSLNLNFAKCVGFPSLGFDKPTNKIRPNPEHEIPPKNNTVDVRYVSVSVSRLALAPTPRREDEVKQDGGAWSMVLRRHVDCPLDDAMCG